MTKISLCYTMNMCLFNKEEKMKEYLKPVIEEELVELCEIIAASNVGATKDGESGDLEDIMGGILS
jgi:hypothetical protein